MFWNRCANWSPWRKHCETPPRKHSISLPKPPSASAYTASNDKALQIISVDPCLAKNGTDHRTKNFEQMWRYENKQLVVRRGQPFCMKLTLNRSYSPKDDSISFIFSLKDVEQVSHGQGSLVAIPLLKESTRRNSIDNNNWSAVQINSEENVITVQITPAHKALIGKWSMEIDTKLTQMNMLNYTYPDNIYVLFNPWCRNDTVYMKNEDERNEYILDESGMIFRGTHKIIKPTIWKFAQFDKDILDCSLLLIRKIGKTPVTSWNDPVKIVRDLSAAVNSQDDYGVVMGNWSEEYSGGTNPCDWVGSRKIIQKYYKTRKPVKYGQCWVFAGVLTTVCRCLGIPARPVTCYMCGHDSKNSLTIDYFIDEKGNQMEELQNESIWNFHVWVEAWMKRPDIGIDFDGWQLIDASPQELSDEMYRCGPTPVHAIKSGQVMKPYDGLFAFSMCNADVVYWRYFGPTQPLKLVTKETERIGQLICTKAPGLWEKKDITNLYKYPESSTDERSVMHAALKKSGHAFSRYYLNQEFNDIKFDFQLLDDIVIGSPFKVSLNMKNKSSTKDFKVAVNLSVQPVLYTGVPQGVIKSHQRDILVEKKSEESVVMEVSYQDYADKLVEQCAFNITCHAFVKDSDYDYYAEDDFRVRQPDIKLHMLDKPVVNKKARVTAEFVNPLPITIKKGTLTLDGPGVLKKNDVKLTEILPNTKVTSEFVLLPGYYGKHTLVAKFASKELRDVDGFLTIIVEEA